MPDVLKVLYNACDPFKPATSDQWVDCNKERGSKVLAHRFCSDLRRSDGFVRFLFSGHFGCGKSSELEHLANLLRDKGQHTAGKRYFPVVMDADDYLDRNDADLIDLLLAVATEISSAFRTRLNIDLQESYLNRRFGEVKEYFGTEAEPDDVEFNFGVAKFKVKRLAKDRKARAQVRNALAREEGSLVAAINLLLEKAHLELKKQKDYDGLVLILDNLEKVRRTKEKDDEESALHEFFISNAPQLSDFAAHVIYTIPLRLVSGKAGELKEQYGVAPFVLPMIKVVERDRTTPYQPGYGVMREILQGHINGYLKRQDDPHDKTPISVDDAIEPEALDLLIRYSGGSARELMRYIREATSELDDAPITINAARAALQSTVDLYSRSIAQRFWEKLARLERSPDQQIDNDDPDYRELLTQVAIMEYRNGGGRSGFSEKDEPWYGVHPIVRELSRFQEALKRLDAETALEGATPNGG